MTVNLRFLVDDNFVDKRTQDFGREFFKTAVLMNNVSLFFLGKNKRLIIVWRGAPPQGASPVESTKKTNSVFPTGFVFSLVYIKILQRFFQSFNDADGQSALRKTTVYVFG